MQNRKKNTELAISKNETSGGQGIRLENMKMPVCDGDIRNYPRFMSDFFKTSGARNEIQGLNSLCFKIVLDKNTT